MTVHLGLICYYYLNNSHHRSSCSHWIHLHFSSLQGSIGKTDKISHEELVTGVRHTIEDKEGRQLIIIKNTARYGRNPPYMQLAIPANSVEYAD